MKAVRYPVPAARVCFEEEIQRSRFITRIAPAATVAEARAFIEEMRQAYSDASHNCWAYLIGPPGSSAFVGFSDDGEPHGTAGRPMLNVLAHSGVGDLAAVVTRYFGGTKLGKGGLARAYGNGVKQALGALTTCEKVDLVQRSVALDYGDLAAFKRLLASHEGKLLDEAFAARVVCHVQIPRDLVDCFEAELISLTQARADLLG